MNAGTEERWNGGTAERDQKCERHTKLSLVCRSRSTVHPFIRSSVPPFQRSSGYRCAV